MKLVAHGSALERGNYDKNFSRRVRAHEKLVCGDSYAASLDVL
jgi:hypothetical protein